jgi:hypothetical protein
MRLRLNISVISARNIGGTIYVTISEGGRCRVSRLRGGDVEDVVSMLGSPCVLLRGRGDEFLVSAGNSLYLIFGNEGRPVLRGGVGNWFWHAVEGDGLVFVQEYGGSPTGIYVSEDLRSFRRVVTNVDVDPTSRHFHYIAFDGGRGLLIATLGDGNIVRAAVSSDHGFTWRPIYKDPWQFVPVLVDGGRWVFGFDSGIARGGVGIYDVEDERWRFIFLRLGGHPHAQFASLVRFSGYYVGGLGSPTAIVVSEDLRYWYPLYVDASIPGYNHFVGVEVWGDDIVATTGKELLVFDPDDVREAFSKGPILTPYGAYFDRVRGVAYMVRRGLWRFWE